MIEKFFGKQRDEGKNIKTLPLITLSFFESLHHIDLFIVIASHGKVKDRIASQTKSPSYTSEKNSLRSELRRVMNILTEREAQIVEMRFGLSNGNEMTLEEIGKVEMKTCQDPFHILSISSNCH